MPDSLGKEGLHFSAYELNINSLTTLRGILIENIKA